MSLLWWQAVAGILEGTSRNVLRNNSRCTWRHRAGARNGDNTAIRRALSPWRPGGNGTAEGHGCPRSVAPLRRYTARRDTPVATRGRRHDAIAAHASECAARPLLLFSPPAMASPHRAVRRQCLLGQPTSGMVKGADRRCKLGLELKRSAEEGNVTKVDVRSNVQPRPALSGPRPSDALRNEA